MIDKQQMINEIKANGTYDGLKTDDKTTLALADRVLNNNHFVTGLYNLFWEAVLNEAEEEDFIKKEEN